VEKLYARNAPAGRRKFQMATSVQRIRTVRVVGAKGYSHLGAGELANLRDQEEVLRGVVHLGVLVQAASMGKSFAGNVRTVTVGLKRESAPKIAIVTEPNAKERVGDGSLSFWGAKENADDKLFFISFYV